jgi:hypothetical protein
MWNKAETVHIIFRVTHMSLIGSLRVWVALLWIMLWERKFLLISSLKVSYILPYVLKKKSCSSSCLTSVKGKFLIWSMSGFPLVDLRLFVLWNKAETIHIIFRVTHMSPIASLRVWVALWWIMLIAILSSTLSWVLFNFCYSYRVSGDEGLIYSSALVMCIKLCFISEILNFNIA